LLGPEINNHFYLSLLSFLCARTSLEFKRSTGLVDFHVTGLGVTAVNRKSRLTQKTNKQQLKKPSHKWYLLSLNDL
jgi:hypothetical protein